MKNLLHVSLVLATFLPALPLLADGPSGLIITGKIEVLPAGGTSGNWTVAGQTVQVTAQTQIGTANGPAIVGTCVEAKGSIVNATTIAATSITTLAASKCAQPPPSNQVEIFGSVELLPASGLVGDWKVAGLTIRVTSQTQIEQEGGPVALGSCAEITGTRNADNSLAATKIEVSSGISGCRTESSGSTRQQFEFRGSVQTAPAAGSQIWIIGGRRVLVNASTTTRPTGRDVTVGSCVEVRGRLESDNSITAAELQILGSGVCNNGLNRQADVSFFGNILVLPSGSLIGDWTIATLTVKVTNNTRIESENATPVVGGCVEVRGDFAGNNLNATRIVTRPANFCQQGTGLYRFEGPLEAFPSSGIAGAWKVGGRNVTADAATTLDTSKGAVALGACVGVSGALQQDASVRATRIEVISTSGACILSGGVVSGGNLSGSAVSAGAIISIFGNQLGPATSLQLQILNNTVTSDLSHTKVLFDGTPATLLMVSQGQINAIVPCNVAGKTSVKVQVETNGAWTNVVTLPVQDTTPSLFTLASSGAGPGAILNTDYSLNTASNATARGGTALLFGTGEGATNPNCSDGAITSLVGPFPVPVAPVTVEVGGKPATVVYAGGAPGLVRGLIQVNFTLAPDTPVGPAIPVIMKIGTRTSQTGVTMAVK